jgi:Bardet-Biedl syndrome 9 protein
LIQQQRVLLQQFNTELRNLAHQFRSIQKRLLIRYKERNPTPLNNIDSLFHLTYNKLINTANKVEETQQRLKEATCLLSAGTRLILLLAQLHMEMPDSQIEILRHFLSPEVEDSEELVTLLLSLTLFKGWEEITFASMTQLLSTCLAKSAKESSATPQKMKFPKDTEKLKKRIVLVFDRIFKGGKLYMEQPKKKSKSSGSKKNKL